MPSERKSPPELVAAAEAFAGELAVFGKLAESARTLPLTSQRGLQRAARVYQEIGESEARLGAAGQALVAAIGNARELQQAQAAAIQARAEEIQARTTLCAELLGRYGALGEEAAQASALAREVLQNQRGPGAGADAEMNRALLELHERLSQLVGGAQALTEDAKQAGFEDLTRQADVLRQQLLAVRGKIATLSAVDRGVAKA